MKTSGWIMVVLLGAGCGGRQQSVRGTPLAGVPEPAAATLRAQAGSATIEAVERETEDDIEVYEGSWHEGGLLREASVTADGKLVELEVELAAADVPAPVRDGAARELDGATTMRFVRLLHDVYEVQGVVGGRKQEIRLNAAGERLPSHDNDDSEHEGD